MKTGKLTVDDLILAGGGRSAATLRVGDISVIEVAGNYLTLRRSDGEPVITRGSLARCKQRMPEHFFAAGRNYMVNLAEVAKVNMASKTFVLIMKDGTHVPVSRNQSRALRKGLAL